MPPFTLQVFLEPLSPGCEDPDRAPGMTYGSPALRGNPGIPVGEDAGKPETLAPVNRSYVLGGHRQQNIVFMFRVLHKP